MTLFAVTVVGHDRPGIVAEVTEAIAGLGGNLEDSSMTLLRGHFAMTLVAEVAATRSAIADALGGLSGSGLVVSVLEMPAAASAEEGQRYLLSVHGGDRPGIVSAVTRQLADSGGNIVDLSTRLADGFYVLLADVLLPSDRESAVTAELARCADELGVAIRLSPVDEDVM